MSYTIESYKKDIERLVKKGDRLYYAMLFECKPDDMRKIYESSEEFEEVRKVLPDFREEYQSWYSEAKILVKHLLPDRLDDFMRYFEKPKNRKNIDFESYRIDDFLQGLQVTSPRDVIIADSTAAIPQFQQQLAIIKGLRKRFESSLYDIRLHLQAEMFDDELEAASYLLKNRFLRAAGAMAGVVLERHLNQVCLKSGVKLSSKKHLSISDYNDALQREKIIDTADWRKIQHLGDLRNKCDHSKEVDPTDNDIRELIEGVTKFTKTLFG
jgi:hypothetical protein